VSDPLTQLTPSAVTWIGAALTPPELSDWSSPASVDTV